MNRVSQRRVFNNVASSTTGSTSLGYARCLRDFGAVDLAAAVALDFGAQRARWSRQAQRYRRLALPGSQADLDLDSFTKGKWLVLHYTGLRTHRPGGDSCKRRRTAKPVSAACESPGGDCVWFATNAVRFFIQGNYVQIDHSNSFLSAPSVIPT